MLSFFDRAAIEREPEGEENCCWYDLSNKICVTPFGFSGFLVGILYQDYVGT